MSAIAVLPSQPAKCPLPIENLPKTTSATIEDKDGKMVAHCALVQCTKAQAYVILQKIDAKIAPKAVTVTVPDMDRPFDLKIETVKDVHPERAHLPMYIQVHYNPDERFPIEHLMDLLSETLLGRFNLELRKNLTIDLFDSAADAIIRDGAGFIIADRHRLQQITVDAKQALRVLEPSKDVIISPASADLTDLLDYDATLSGHQRADFLRFLMNDHQVLVAKWSPEKLAADELKNLQLQKEEESTEIEDKKRSKKSKENEANSTTIAGYLIASGERVLGLYAEDEKIADALLAEYIGKLKTAGTLTFCTTTALWARLRAHCSTLRTRPIYRRHTRVVPSNVKYEKLFAWNIGMHFF